MVLLHVDGGTDHCLGLHLGNLRVGDSQTAAAVAHHGVELMERVADSLDLLHRLALGVSQLLDIFLFRGNELMERRIQEADGNWIALQSLVKLLEVALLLGKDLLQSGFPLLQGFRTDHLTESIDTVALKEHMLSTAKADSLRSQLPGFPCVSRGICIGAHL